MPEQVSWAQALSGIEESAPLDFEPIPSGDYLFTIISGEERTAQTSGNPQFNMRARIDSEGKFKGRNLFFTWTLALGNPRAMGIVLTNLINVGVDKAWLGSGPTNPEILQSMIGAKFKGTLQQGTYNDKVRYNMNSREFLGREAVTQPGVPSVVSMPSPAVVSPAQHVTYQQPVAQTVLPPTSGNPFRQ